MNFFKNLPSLKTESYSISTRIYSVIISVYFPKTSFGTFAENSLERLLSIN